MIIKYSENFKCKHDVGVDIPETHLAFMGYLGKHATTTMAENLKCEIISPDLGVECDI